MGDDLTTNKLDLELDELVDKIGFEPQPSYSWMGMTIDDDDGTWSWMDEDTRTPNELLKDHLKELMVECKSPHNDGYTAAHYKKQIWQMKCWIEDIYANLPVFDDEKDWEKERIFEKLSEDPNGGKK